MNGIIFGRLARFVRKKFKIMQKCACIRAFTVVYGSEGREFESCLAHRPNPTGFGHFFTFFGLKPYFSTRLKVAGMLHSGSKQTFKKQSFQDHFRPKIEARVQKKFKKNTLEKARFSVPFRGFLQFGNSMESSMELLYFTSAAKVFTPQIPSAVSPAAFWKDLTAASQPDPKDPSKPAGSKPRP